MIQFAKINFQQLLKIQLILALFLFGNTSYSNEYCENSFRLFTNGAFSSQKDDLYKKIREAYPKEADELIKGFDSLYFVDFNHHRELFAKILLEDASLAKTKLHGRYDTFHPLRRILNFFRNLFSKNPKDIGEFANFQRAREILKRGDISSETLRAAHKSAMAGGVENIAKENIGNFRGLAVIGDSRGTGLTAEELVVIEKNPYLSFEETMRTDEKIFGKILYPSPKNVKPEILERIYKQNPTLVDQIRALQKSDPNGAKLKSYQRALMQELTDERFAWFIRQKNQIGPLVDAKKIDAYINLVAEFQRDIISIHPFANGNGRTSRALLYALLEKEGLPPPRILDPNSDIQTSLEKWQNQIKDGMASTIHLFSDIDSRIKLGLPLENSPELFGPMIPREYPVDFKVAGKKVVTENYAQENSDAKQFRMWLKHYLKTNSGVFPPGGAEKIQADYVAFAKGHSLVFEHQKDGLRNISLKFADDDFVAAFGKNVASTSAQWTQKMDNWYKPEIIWRGLSYKDKEVSKEEILDIFRKPHPQMASNETAKNGMDASGIVESAKKDFVRYNQDLFDNKLQNMARDHSETGPMYGSSYGYSTSKRREVGKAFAMGAMVVAEYGQHQNFQHLLKSRILIGAYRASKDVDLSRLHQFKDDFVYKYPRQSEVMGIGAAEPDSIMVVQRIGADGEAIESYVRNPNNPSEIWVVKGQYEPETGQGRPAERLVETIPLFDK